MSEPLLLCRVCLAWCEPILDTCTTCASVLEATEPDLPRSDLERRLGTVVHSLGNVDVFRSNLPSSGQLLATTTGLLFLPALREHPRGGWIARTAPRTPLGLWSHHLLLQFQHWWQPARSDSTFGPALPHDGSPADWLMDSPGGLFVDLESIKYMTIRRDTLRIDRGPWRTLSIVSSAPKSELVRAMGELDQHAAWQRLLG